MTNAEYREEKRKVKMPLFFKRKIFMVMVMLMCSGVMVVMATYAWFILSTAPEVTGVLTTVGANGSLEIALLDPTTGPDPTRIQAEVGDSIYVRGKVEGNVTWGNLVDLSDPAYGLSGLVLYPSVLNAEDGVLDTQAMLSTARNGLDGRITRVSANTTTAIYDGSVFTTEGASYGVRAVGSANARGGRAGYLASAKSRFTASKQSALSAVQNTLNSYGGAFAGFINSSDGTLTYENVEAIKNLTNGTKTALENVLSSYKQAMIATAAASSSLSDTDFDTVRTGISSASGNALSSYATYLPDGVSIADVNAISNSIAQADVAIELANNLLFVNYGTEDEEPAPADTTYTTDQVRPIVNILADTNQLDRDAFMENLTLSATQGPGLFTDVADHIGSYNVSLMGYTLRVLTGENGGDGKLGLVDLSGLTAPESTGTGTASTLVTDFYGYVIDLAFRANVATDLQLQTEVVDRIYTDGAGATRGSGSNVTYTFASGMSQTQVRAMLSAVRVVLFDPDTGDIYCTARLGTPTINAGDATASLYIVGENDALSPDGTAITALEEAVPKKVSALIYLNGSDMSNISVTNAENSGTLLLNLQFSSSTVLVPMTDNELISAASAEDYNG